MLLVNYLSPPPSCRKDSQCIMGRWSCFQDSLLQPLSLGMNKLIMFQVAVLDVRLSILHKSAYKLNLTLHYLRSKRLGAAVPNNSNVNIAVSCISSVQFSSVTQSCPTLGDPMNCSTPGLLVHHQLLEFTQTHVHRVSHAIQPSHPLSSPSPLAPNPSQHQSLVQ